MTNFTWLYVGVLYGVAVAIARRANVELPRRLAVLFFALVLGFLWKPLTQDFTIVSADVIKLTPPWSEVRAPGRPPVTKLEIANLGTHDVPMQIVPWLHQVRESWRRLDVPLWNATAGTGYPLLANGQSTPLSPFRILTLPLSLDHAMTAECAFKLLLALVFMYLFCRLRYSQSASVLAAIAYAFSTWMTVWLQFPIAFASALLPGVLLVIDRLLQDATRARVLGAALLFAVTVLSGHPETVYHVGLIAAAYGIWNSRREHGTRNTEHGTNGASAARRSAFRVLRSTFRGRGRGRGLASVALSSAIALLLTLPQIVPFAEAVLRSQRFGEMRAPRATIEPPYSDFNCMTLLVNPRFFGEVPIELPWGPAVLESVCAFAGVLAIASIVAAAIYIVLRRRWRSPETLYVLGALFSLAVIDGWPVVTEAFHAIAGLAPTMRMRLGICFFGALLIAPVIDWARRDTKLPLLLGALSVSAFIFYLLRAMPFPTESHRITAILGFLPSMAVLAAIALLPMRRISMIPIGALIVMELWFAIGNWNAPLHPRELYWRTPVISALQRLQQNETQPFRILGTGGQLYPNTNSMYGLEDVRVHDPMAFGKYVDLIAQTVAWKPHEYYAKWNEVSTPFVDFLNVKYVIADRELTEPRFEKLYEARDGRIYRNNEVLPRFFAVRNVLLGGDPAQHTDWRYTAIVSRMPRRLQADLTAPWTSQDARVEIVSADVDRYKLRVHAPRSTLVVSSIANYPGWRTGFTNVEVNGAFLGFVVPAGTHDVDVRYRPMSFYASAVISLLTLLTMLALWRTPRADRAR